jgi:hypothetical protein
VDVVTNGVPTQTGRHGAQVGKALLRAAECEREHVIERDVVARDRPATMSGINGFWVALDQAGSRVFIPENIFRIETKIPR